MDVRTQINQMAIEAGKILLPRERMKVSLREGMDLERVAEYFRRAIKRHKIQRLEVMTEKQPPPYTDSILLVKPGWRPGETAETVTFTPYFRSLRHESAQNDL